MGKTCAICGKPSGMYPLCKECFKLKDEGKVVKCEECGTWYLTDEGCPNCKPVKIELPKMTSNADELACIICGKPSNGKHFCKECYFRFNSKAILIKINKCELPCGEPLDESYEGVYECEDGHIVKSQAERDIDDYLYENNIFHGYELPLDVGEDNPLKPDFCLKNYLGEGKDVYIEYFGYQNDPQYDKRTAYKLPLYRKNKITLICMYAKTDLKNIKFALRRKLDKKRIKENEINFEE